jgi:hypothetical protein
MEDDDLYLRLVNVFGETPKLDKEIGRYQALPHDRVKDLDATPLFLYNRRYLAYAQLNPKTFLTDGINTVRYHVVDVAKSPLGYTKYTVGLDLPWMPATLDDLPSQDLFP